MIKDKKIIIDEFALLAKEILKENASQIILYGSYARGDYKDNSDIDIIILTSLSDEEIDREENRIFDLAFDFQMKYLVDISVILKNKDHFKYWEDTLPFYRNIKKEGILLNG